MTSDGVRSGVMAGVVAAAATGGAIVALAARAGSVTRPFGATGRAVLGAIAPPTAALLGVALHVAVCIAWGLLLGALAHRLRGLALLGASGLVALLAYLVHTAFLPTFRLGFGLGVFPLRGALLVWLYGLFAAALAAGIRLAR